MFPRLYCLSLNGGGCLEGWLEDALDKWERKEGERKEGRREGRKEGRKGKGGREGSGEGGRGRKEGKEKKEKRKSEVYMPVYFALAWLIKESQKECGLGKDRHPLATRTTQEMLVDLHPQAGLWRCPPHALTFMARDA